MTCASRDTTTRGGGLAGVMILAELAPFSEVDRTALQASQQASAGKRLIQLSCTQKNGPLRGRCRFISIRTNSRKIKAIGVHHLGPGRHEILDELLFRAFLPIDFGDGAELGV